MVTECEGMSIHKMHDMHTSYIVVQYHSDNILHCITDVLDIMVTIGIARSTPTIGGVGARHLP